MVQTIKRKSLTLSELEALLKPWTRSTAFVLEYVVDDTRSRQEKGEYLIQKRVLISPAFLNHNYTKKVRELTGDATFEALPMKGKTRISTTLVQSDKTGDMLLDAKVNYIRFSNASKILALYHKGKEITEAEAVALDLWAPSYYKPKEKKTAGRGTVSEDDNFSMFTVALKNIEWMRFCKTIYTVIK